jgi:SAM-dependent methyltransferase
LNPRLQRAQDLLRRAHLLRAVDGGRLCLQVVRCNRGNRAAVREHPGLVLPPAGLAHDAYGTVDGAWYWQSGAELARELVDLCAAHGMPSPSPVLDWGCGPGRVVRHIPDVLPEAEVHGADYNPATVRWCTAHVPGVDFVQNDLVPPLPFPSGMFRLVYAVSVVTHLSRPVAAAWLAELSRVMTPGGLLVLWTNGDNVAATLLPREQQDYERDRYVTRRGVDEGSKWFLAVHPQTWVREEAAHGFSIEQWLPGGFTGKDQDVWVLRKPAQ